MQPDEVKWGSKVLSILEGALRCSREFKFPVVPIQCLFVGILDSENGDYRTLPMSTLKSIYDTVVHQLKLADGETLQGTLSTEVEGWGDEVVSQLHYSRTVALERGSRYVDQFDLLVSMLRCSSSCSWPVLSNAGIREKDIKSCQVAFYQESKSDDKHFHVTVSPEVLFLVQSSSNVIASRRRKRELLMLNVKFKPTRAVIYNALRGLILFAAIGLLSNFVTHLGLIPSLAGGVIVWAVLGVANFLLGFVRLRRTKRQILSRWYKEVES